jgi:hypothetical protein
VPADFPKSTVVAEVTSDTEAIEETFSKFGLPVGGTELEEGTLSTPAFTEFSDFGFSSSVSLISKETLLISIII